MFTEDLVLVHAGLQKSKSKIFKWTLTLMGSQCNRVNHSVACVLPLRGVLNNLQMFQRGLFLNEQNNHINPNVAK